MAGAVLWTALAFAPAAAQEAAPALTHEFSVRLRPRFSTTSVPDEDEARLEYSRMRLQGRVGAFDWVQARIQIDYDAGEWSVDDAWVQLRLTGETALLVGQAKRPFTVLSMRSGSRVGTVSRGGSIRGAEVLEEQNLVNDLQFGDRAIGAQLSGAVPFAPRGVRFEAGVFPMDGADAPFDLRRAQVSARVTAEVAPSITVGTAWSRRHYETDEGDPAGRGSVVALDVEAGEDAPGLHLLAEVVAGEAETHGSFRAGQAWLLYRTETLGRARLTFEPLLRVSAAGGDLRDEDGPGVLTTSGLNVYVGDPDRWNRLMVNFDRWSPRDGSRREHSLKVQLQIGT